MLLPESLRRQPKWLVLAEALTLVGLIGWFDHASGWEWSCYAPYAIPITLVAWKLGRGPGFGFAFLCAATYWISDRGSNPYQTPWGFALAVIVWLFYFAVLVVATAKVKAQQELDQARIQTLMRTQELERQILQTSEREQQRIGRDLHDSLVPHLAAMGYAASFLADDLCRRSQPEAAKAEQFREMAGNAVVLARNLARGIFPTQTDGSGLSLALAELASTTSGLTGVSISYCEAGEIQVKDSETGMHLYRIVQEAVNNATKHGGARKVTILLNKSEDSLRLAVADDGKGMAPSSNGARGMGLQSMSYRARALGGELKIDSNPSDGTVVSCEIPMRSPQSATPVS